MGHEFECDNLQLQNKYQAALDGLKSNLRKLDGFDEEVIIEGGMYGGIWLECGPLENAVYKIVDPEVAIAGHRVFFKNQRMDGYIPAAITTWRVFTGQIQMVVPIAATALEIAKYTQREDFLEEAYTACVKWEEWLARYRNTRGTGLCEMFCEWDTGHDQSPRVHGLPQECPGSDARVCPDLEGLPYLAPDLSATVYGGRVALAEMARLLGKNDEAQQWEEKAECIREAILTYCYDAENTCFFDLNAKNRFVRITGDILTRVLSEHVVDQKLFDSIFEKHLSNPEEFWTPYPFPSIAINDPHFVKELPNNSWGGATQALTALRAPRWLNYYKRSSWLSRMMKIWLRALVHAPGFQQQMNPWTGVFTTTEGYSPAMCVMLEYIPRLCGVRLEEDEFEWNCDLPEDTEKCKYSLDTRYGTAEISRKDHVSIAKLAGKQLFEVTGVCRIITDRYGKIRKIIGVDLGIQEVKICINSDCRVLIVEPNIEYVYELLEL